MADTLTEDQPGFVVDKLEHRFTCYRLSRPGRIYCLAIEHEVLCADCVLFGGEHE
jgi:hypothetical protein